jgi:G3E family GTPase
VIVLNKIDLAAPDRLAPGATVVMTDHARLPLAVMFGARPVERAGADPAAGEPDAHHPGSYTAGLVERPPMSRAAFETLAGELSREVIRAKGHVALTEAPGVRYLYQQVGRRWTLVEDGTWDARGPITRIVTIAVRATVPHDRPITSVVG